MEICVVMILKRPFLCRAYFFSLNIDGTEKGALREAVCPTNGSFDAGKGFILLCWTHCLSHALRHTYLFLKITCNWQYYQLAFKQSLIPLMV